MIKLLTFVLGIMLVAQHSHARELVVAQAATQRETLSGFTRARTHLVLSSEASGKVLRVNADVGDVIPADGPFACLDPTYIDLEIRANQTEMASLRVDARHFSKQVKRFNQLLKQNSSSESQLDDAQHNLDKALSQLSSLKIQDEILQERKRRSCVVAPEGWRVVRRHVEVGQWINTGEPMVEVGDFSRLLVPFALSSDEFQALEARTDTLTLRLPEQNLQVAARIERVSPAFDEASRKIYVELEIADGEIQPRGGLRAELGLDIPLRSGAVLLPASALAERYEERWLTRPDGGQISVVYLGSSKVMGSEWVRVTSPEVEPGDRFQLTEE
ncbi:MAG: efflux RND transporter periplasmic adaptor subunit [Pseudomonadota bacterium]